MQVIGLCRFSYPALGGFQVEHQSIEARMAYLWADTRLEERFRLFETIALPCLRAQTDPDFTLVVLVAELFPAQHLQRLRDLTADVPQIKLIAQPPRNNREVTKALLNAARRDPNAPCLQFRYDDDDAIAVDFVERARAAAASCAPLLDQHVSVAFDWTKGFIARVGPDGIAATDHAKPFNTAGMAMYIKAGSKQTVHNFAHTKISRFMPCVSFPEPDMYVRTHNGFNDSRQKPVKTVEVAPLTPEQEAHFEARFAISSKHVRSVFGQP